ncbi:MAG: hypothetical protein NT149_03340 [Candidatus Gottesmanbacteria bacterium]|nr:hypothetical protein [Candidatus Gottesmanbacteria bacterium]
MVLNLLKEVFGQPTVQIRVGSSQAVEMSVADRSNVQFVRPDWNIAEAQKNGIQPVNFHRLSQQFSETDLSNAVLFDTPPRGAHAGNHWRITDFNNEHGLVSIQLCGGGGNYDYQMPPFTVSQYDILFTGAKIEHYEKNGVPIQPLSVVVNLIANLGEHPKDLTLAKETVYWVDANGKLLLKGEHPLFKKH